MPETKSYVTMRVLAPTHAALKVLADLRHQPMTDVLDAVVQAELRQAREADAVEARRQEGG